METLVMIILVIACLVLIACAKEDTASTDVLVPPTLPDEVYDYTSVDLSMHPDLGFGNSSQFLENQVSDQGATLGRVLFYDTKLSATNRISCGSCHLQQAGFSDMNKFSPGFNNQVTTRNSMSISNLVFMNSFFWDNRIDNLEDLVLMPIQNHIEMGMEDIDILVEKLSAVSYYDPLFENAFGSPQITSEKISSAVAQFLKSMVSLNAKYDEGRSENFNNFTPMEQLGRTIFLGKASCGNCHNEPTFDSRWGGIAANIGLDLHYDDPGMGALSNSPFNGATGFFKIPSLRNIELTAPYMHDGRFNTLEEVVNHYNEGIQNHPFLDWRLSDTDPVTGERTAKKLGLDELEKMALVAFLKTLTDDSYLHDVRFSNPFQ